MRFRSRIPAAAAAFLLLVSPLSALSDVNDAQVTRDGTPDAGKQIYGWDGTAQRAVGADANRALSTVNKYPAGLQFSYQTLYASTVANATAVSSVPLTEAAHYAMKALDIVQSGYANGTGSITGGMIYRPMFSNDCVTYTPWLYQRVAAAESLGVQDTLQYRTYTNFAAGMKRQVVDPVTGNEIPCACFRVDMINRGGATVTSTVVLGFVPRSN